jgi:hypothetical protein
MVRVNTIDQSVGFSTKNFEYIWKSDGLSAQDGVQDDLVRRTCYLIDFFKQNACGAVGVCHR